MRNLLVVAALATAMAAAPGTAVGATDKPPVATVDSGHIVGTSTADTLRFLGIPYAKAPVGDLRWASPQPVPPWTGVRDATRSGAACVQPAFFDGTPARGSEDCLYLDVTTPRHSRGRALPVMVWLHGGAYLWGAGADFGPDRLAARGDVIVVTVNYRLGVFGFLAHPSLDGAGQLSGNFGLADQQAALRWMRRNAAAFGGDPGSVTVFGESSGARSVCAQLASPAAAGLFDRAVIQSEPCTMTSSPDGSGAPSPAPPGFPRPREQANAQGVAVATRLGCPDPAGAAGCLRALDANTLRDATTFQDWFAPAIGGGLLPHDPATTPLHPVPVLHGITRDEHRIAGAFEEPLTADGYLARVRAWAGPRADEVLARYPLDAYATPIEAWSAVITDATYARPMADLGARLTAPVYAYEFADRDAPWMSTPPPAFDTGAYHTSELQYLFTTAGFNRPLSAAQRRLSDQMMRYWARFAHAGDPNGPGLPYWPRLHSGSGRAQQLDTGPGGVRQIHFDRRHQVDFWRSMG